MASSLRRVELSPTPGVLVAVEILDGNPPAYVYMHGLSATRAGDKSDALLERARRHGRGFARFDLRGHGESSGTLADITLTELIEDTTAVLRRVGPSLLVGSSLGALVAAWAAARNPELVLGLTMLAPALGFLPEIARARQQGQPVSLRTSEGTEMTFSPRAIEDTLSYDEEVLPVQLEMPTLIVHGQLDESVPFQLSQRFFDALPHDKKDLWLVPEGGHRLNDLIDKIYDRMEALMGRV